MLAGWPELIKFPILIISEDHINQTSTGMSYQTNFASNIDFGIVKIGNGIAVSNGTISVQFGGGGWTTGTWAPAISSSLGATITLTVANARYVKVGQLVVCTFDVTVGTESGGGSSGILTLSGLPFLSVSDTGYVGSLYVSYFFNMDSDTESVSGGVINNSTSIDLWQGIGGNNQRSLSRLSQSDIKTGTRLVGSVEYLSAV